MIKKFIVAILLALPFAVSAQSVKIGLVDSNAVIAAMPETTAAQQKLADAQKKYETEYNALQEELKKMYDEINAMKEDELPAIRERKMTAFQDGSQTLQELMAPIMQKVKSAIESVGKEGNFTLVQDLNPQLTFYYSSPAEDITPLVKVKLGLK